MGLTLGGLEEYEKLLDWRSRNLAAATKVGTGVLAGAALVAPIALVAAPAIGGALGASALGGSLTGAAATSHGLAMLGLGSIASGGFGMAGGTTVIVAAGAGLGSAMGATTTAAYVSDDKSFRIERLQDGEGPPVIVASGFLSEGESGWGSWKSIVATNWPGRPVYRVHWGSKELRALGTVLHRGMATGGAAFLAKVFAKKATLAGAKKITPLGLVGAIPGLVANPWPVALNRSEMTAGVLADLLARTEEREFVLAGHSLGARVMIRTAEILAASQSERRLESLHLLGAAAPARGDWHFLDSATNEGVWNYHSRRDPVLSILYRYAQIQGPAAGSVGFSTRRAGIKNVDVSRRVGGHDKYFESVTLRKARAEPAKPRA